MIVDKYMQKIKYILLMVLLCTCIKIDAQLKRNELFDAYIEQYKDYINTDELYSLFYYHINKILNKKIYLHVWYVHNDLCKWNIMPNDINWIEFIDYD